MFFKNCFNPFTYNDGVHNADFDPDNHVMLKLFTGEELLWSGTTVGGWACPAVVLESIFIDGLRN